MSFYPGRTVIPFGHAFGDNPIASGRALDQEKITKLLRDLLSAVAKTRTNRLADISLKPPGQRSLYPSLLGGLPDVNYICALTTIILVQVKGCIPGPRRGPGSDHCSFGIGLSSLRLRALSVR